MVQIRRGAIRPIQCYAESWRFVKEQYWLLFGVTFVGMLIGSLAPLAVLLGPMMCGIYLCLFQRMRGERVEFGTLFKGFELFAQSLIATLVIVAVTLVVMAPVFLAYMFIFIREFASAALRGDGQGGAGAPPLGLLLSVEVGFFAAVMILALIMGVFLSFVYPLICEAGMPGLKAITTSLRAALANLGGCIALMAIGMVLGMAGYLLCCVGIYLVIPFTFGAWAVAYTQVFEGKEEAAPDGNVLPPAVAP